MEPDLTKREEKILKRCRKVKDQSLIWYFTLWFGILAGVFILVRGIISKSGVGFLTGWSLIIFFVVVLKEKRDTITLVRILDRILEKFGKE
jgi:hypothetical protein